VSVSHANISTSSRNESCRTLFPCKHAAVRGPTHAKCTVPYACTARGRGAWPGGCMQLVRSDCCDLAEAIVCSVYGGGVPATAQDQTSEPSKPGFPEPLGTGPVPPETGRTGPAQYTNRSCSQSQTVPIIFYPQNRPVSPVYRPIFFDSWEPVWGRFGEPCSKLASLQLSCPPSFWPPVVLASVRGRDSWVWHLLSLSLH
jgi:hypothetical protein